MFRTTYILCTAKPYGSINTSTYQKGSIEHTLFNQYYYVTHPRYRQTNMVNYFLTNQSVLLGFLFILMFNNSQRTNAIAKARLRMIVFIRYCTTAASRTRTLADWCQLMLKTVSFLLLIDFNAHIYAHLSIAFSFGSQHCCCVCRISHYRIIHALHFLLLSIFLFSHLAYRRIFQRA